jgi:hypothetical protein
MPRPCTVCTNPRVDEINAAIVGGEPRMRVARRFGLKEPAVRYHAGRHLPDHLGLARCAGEVAKADKLLGRVRLTADRLETAMNKAEAANDVRTMVIVARELRPWLELLGRLDGSRGAAPDEECDPHELAREAKRYLGWYDEQLTGASGRSKRPPSRGSRVGVRLNENGDEVYELELPEGYVPFEDVERVPGASEGSGR